MWNKNVQVLLNLMRTNAVGLAITALLFLANPKFGALWLVMSVTLLFVSAGAKTHIKNKLGRELEELKQKQSLEVDHEQQTSA